MTRAKKKETRERKTHQEHPQPRLNAPHDWRGGAHSLYTLAAPNAALTAAACCFTKFASATDFALV